MSLDVSKIKDISDDGTYSLDWLRRDLQAVVDKMVAVARLMEPRRRRRIRNALNRTTKGGSQ